MPAGVERFMERTFKLARNRVIAAFLSLTKGRAAVDGLRFYALAYQAAREGRDGHVYFPLPFGPAVILVHAASFDISAPFGCAAALSNCSLMAHSLGLGSCFLGFVQLGANMDRNIRHWLGIPRENQCNGAMVVGYPDIRYRRLVERKSPEIKWC